MINSKIKNKPEGIWTRSVVVLAVLLLQVVLLTPPAFSETEYTKTVNFCPINTSYKKFSHILDHIRNFIQNANSNFTNDKYQIILESLTLGDQYIRITIDKDFQLSSLYQGPETATFVYYNYQNYPDKRPISAVEMKLNNYYRELTVTGNDKTQVNDLVSIIKEDFKELGCTIGGHDVQGIIAFLIFLLAGIFFFAYVFYYFKNKKIFYPSLIFLLAITIIVYSLQIQTLLPGTAVRSGPVSFLDRNSWLWGLIWVIVALILGGVVKLLWNKFISPKLN